MIRRIAITEDEARTTVPLRDLLEKRFFQVLSAQDGAAGLELVRAEHPDLVLLDLLWPRRDGFDVCRAIKTDPHLCHIPVVMLTGVPVNPGGGRKGPAAVAERYLTKADAPSPKPVSPRNLLQIIDGLLGQSLEGVPTRESTGSILLLDGSRRQRSVVRVWLERAGFDVTEAATDAEALSCLQELYPDVVIMDLQVGDPLFAKRLRNEWPDVALLLVNLPPDLPLVHADRNQVRYVFLSLINNAIDATPEGGTLTITSELLKAEGEDPQVVLRFEDTGEGIPPENLDRVFDPFFSTRPEVKGRGRGLSASRGIVQQHGGRLTIGSRPGCGTCVAVVLPAASPSREVKSVG